MVCSGTKTVAAPTFLLGSENQVWYFNVQFTSGDVTFGHTGSNFSGKILLHPKAHHEQFDQEHMVSILFQVVVRLDNGEDLWIGEA